jgi:hypothetical protein
MLELARAALRLTRDVCWISVTSTAWYKTALRLSVDWFVFCTLWR